jgi:hypothetical protein
VRVDVDTHRGRSARARRAMRVRDARVDADGVDAPPGAVYAPRRRARTAETSKSTRMEILKDFKASTLTRHLRVVEGDGADDARARAQGGAVDEDGVHGDARAEARGLASSAAGEDLLASRGDAARVRGLARRG